MDQAIRIAALAQAVVDAKDWRETFEKKECQKPSHAIVAFGDDNCMQDSIDSDTMHGYDGWLRMPRDVAVEMMKWLEGRAAKELESTRAA